MWYKTMVENDAAVQKFYYPKAEYVKYIKSKRAGAPDFDVMVK